MLSENEILSILQSELTDADQFHDLITPLDYYLGNPNGLEVTGRSQVTSTDVADAIEWIMPQIMKSFTQNNEVVVFDPIHPGDEKQAEIESEYVYEVLMKENDGFVILHEFVKDALMQQNGIIKVYYEDTSYTSVENWTGLGPEQLQAIRANPNMEIQTEEIDESGIIAKIAITTPNGKICIESIPPEEFRVNNDHNSINLDKAKFTAHITQKTVSELVKQGYDREILDNLPNSDEEYTDYRFAAQDETTWEPDHGNMDPTLKELDVAECYMFIDIDEDGIAEYTKITAAGDNESPTVVLDYEVLDYSPWVSTTAFIMSHKWRGMSIYDRLKEIQDQKTMLWRNMFDNLYYQNNQRTAVVENQVNMDDLLLSRPGGVVRVKRIDAIQPLVTPSVSKDATEMMRYLDMVRAGRAGVTPEGDLQQHQIGERVGSQGVERLMNAREELVGLIVRVVAETGIKPLCVKIRNLCTKHIDAIQDFQFRGQWVKVTPSQWKDRAKCTVRVGTGSGNHAQQVMSLQQIIEYQSQIMDNPAQTIMDEQQLYNTLDDFCKFSGLNGANKYFIDPSSPQGMQTKQMKQQQQQQEQQKQQQIQLLMLKSQVDLAQAEMQKAQAQQDNVALKHRIDSLEQQLEEAKTAIEAAEKSAELEYKYEELDRKTALELTKIESTANKEENENYEANKQTTSSAA